MRRLCSLAAPPLALLLALTAGWAGCRRDAPAAEAAAEVYVVRGEILRLPRVDAPITELWLRHEAIPDFRDASGRVVGMSAMAMPFALAADLDLTGFAPGDPVRCTLEVRWQSAVQPARITRLERLPPGTRLELAAPSR